MAHVRNDAFSSLFSSLFLAFLWYGFDQYIFPSRSLSLRFWFLRSKIVILVGGYYTLVFLQEFVGIWFCFLLFHISWQVLERVGHILVSTWKSGNSFISWCFLLFKRFIIYLCCLCLSNTSSSFINAIPVSSGTGTPPQWFSPFVPRSITASHHRGQLRVSELL